jgi:hypothetical protein
LNNKLYDQEFAYFKIYSSAYVESTDVIRATNSFHGSEWFSDVAVSVDKKEEIFWYGKV